MGAAFDTPIDITDDHGVATLTHHLVGVGQSRRVESYWTRSEVQSADGTRVASVLLHQGVFKASYAACPSDRR